MPPRILTVASLLMLSLLAAVPTRAKKIPPHKSAIVLFNGYDLSNFETFIRGKGLNSDPDHIFQVENGVIHISGNGFGVAGRGVVLTAITRSLQGFRGIYCA